MSENKEPWRRGMPRVAILPFPGIPNAYLCLSGKMRKKSLLGERWYDGHAEHKKEYEDHFDRSYPGITFLYDAGNCCAEWDGEYGPLSLSWRCEESYKREHETVRPHWFYPFAFGVGHWSQIAVDDADLPNLFTTGNYKAIFGTLREWAESRNDDYPDARAALQEGVPQQ